jgi:hypothetical protein
LRFLTVNNQGYFWRYITCLLLLPCLLQAQRTGRFTYGAALNGCKEEIISSAPGVSLSNARAIGFHMNAGWQTIIDTHFVFYTGLRYGIEKSLFDVIRHGKDISEYYYFRNQNVIFVFAPGLVINNRQKLFATIGIGRIYQSNVGGSGVRGGRAYTFGDNETENQFDYRLGMRWQYKLFKEKRIVLEVGTEMSNVQRHGKIVVKNGYNTRPDESYKINYSVLIFYTGFMF